MTPHNRIRCLAILSVFLLVAAAAPAGASGLRLGGQLGGSQTSLMGDLPDEGVWEGSFGPTGGIILEYCFTSDVALSLQPAYVSRDSRQVFSYNPTAPVYTDYELDYISVPLIVRVSGDPTGVTGFVTAGLDLSFLVDATVKKGSDSEDISEGLDPTTIGALFGAGIMVPVKRHFLTFEFRYSQGLDDIVNRGGTDTGMASPSVKYRSFSLLVGFLFSLGGE